MALDPGFGMRLDALRMRAQAQRPEPWQARRERLRKLRGALVKRHTELQKAIAQDLGRPEAETDIVEYLPTITELDHAIANVRRWSKPKGASTPLTLFGARSEILAQPKGVCLIMAPWNYPANLLLGPLIACIAAGNTAVAKPSEFAPATAAYLRDLIAEAFDADEVLLVEGGPETAEALLDQRFDHIFFTGSPKIGRIVMAAAAKGPTSVTLELGGKSPAYVHRSADIADTARKLVWGKFVNAGQTCIAPDYILADEAIAGELKQALTERIRKVFPREIEQGRRGSDLAAIISERHAERLTALIDDACEKGAQVLIGGQTDIASRFVAPTLLDNVNSDMRVDSEEIFGPILPIRNVPGPGVAIAHINAGATPLASYVFTKESGVADRYLAEAPAGGSCVNNTLIHFANERLPFGGIGPSGIGRYHGDAGFEAFSNMRAVMRDRFSLTYRLFPPYTKGMRRQIALFLRLKGAV